MAQTFSKLPPIHRIMLRSFFGWVVFFPESCCTKMEHATPVTLYFIQHIVLLTHGTECFQFIKMHVWSGDLLDFIIQQYILLYFLFLLFSKIIEKNAKHVCITC